MFQNQAGYAQPHQAQGAYPQQQYVAPAPLYPPAPTRVDYSTPYQQFPPSQPPQQNIPTLKGKQVSCIEEAKASPIDIDDSPNVFLDISGTRVYVKQLNDQGTLDFNVFALVPQESLSPTSQTDQEMNAELAAVIARLLQLEQKMQQYEGMIFNATANQPNANNTNAPKQRKPGSTATASSPE